MTKCYTKEEQLYALDVLKFMAEEAKWEKLCQLNEEQKEKYSKLLENFKALKNGMQKPKMHHLIYTI